MRRLMGRDKLLSWSRRRNIPVDLAKPAVIRETRQAAAEAVRHAPTPPSTGLVLEIGAGQAPHHRTDVVVEKYLVDNFERPGGEPVSLSRPLVVADAEQLPFADKSVDYVIALHVLEHATDPTVFASEMSRVGRAGFVQVPSRQAELTFGWPYHPWLIDVDEDATLFFEARGDRTAPLGDEFHSAFASSPLFRLWWNSHLSTWLHSVAWEGRLNVRVAGEGHADQATVDLDASLDLLRRAAQASLTKPLPTSARSALRCPLCRGELLLATNVVACGPCGAQYPLVGNVPVLLPEAAY